MSVEPKLLLCWARPEGLVATQTIRFISRDTPLEGKHHDEQVDRASRF